MYSFMSKIIFLYIVFIVPLNFHMQNVKRCFTVFKIMILALLSVVAVPADLLLHNLELLLHCSSAPCCSQFAVMGLTGFFCMTVTIFN